MSLSTILNHSLISLSKSLKDVPKRREASAQVVGDEMMAQAMEKRAYEWLFIAPFKILAVAAFFLITGPSGGGHRTVRSLLLTLLNYCADLNY